ncbi:MAG: hypothetical protein ABH952_04565 [Candidatus Omnitrophota bacterium]
MSKLKQHILFKLISIVLIQAFFCLDISWAAGGNLKGLSAHLAPAINISGADFAKDVGLIIDLRRAYREVRQIMRITEDINPGQVLDRHGITYSKAAVIDKRRLFIIINDNGNNRVFVVSERGKDPVIKELGPGDGYTVGEAIRILRQGAGLNQGDLGLNQGVISEIERGKTYNPRIETIELIANTLSAALEMDVMPLLQGREVSKKTDSTVLVPIKEIEVDPKTKAYKKRIMEMYGFTLGAADLQEAQEELIIRLRAYFQGIEIYQDIETLTPKDTEEDSEEYREEDIEEVNEDKLRVSTRLMNLGKNYPEIVSAKLAAVVTKEMIDKAIEKEGDNQGTIEPPANIARLVSIKILLCNVWGDSTEASEAQKQLQEQWGATVLTFLAVPVGVGYKFFDTLSKAYWGKQSEQRTPKSTRLPLTKEWARGFFAAYSVLTGIILGVGLWNFFASGMGFASGDFILAQLSAVLVMNLPALLGMIISGVLAYGYYKAWRLPLADGEVGPSWTKEGRISYSQAVNNLPALRQGIVKLSLNLYEMWNVFFPRDDELSAKGFTALPLAIISIGLIVNQIGLIFNKIELFPLSFLITIIGAGIYLGLGVWGSKFVKDSETALPILVRLGNVVTNIRNWLGGAIISAVITIARSFPLWVQVVPLFLAALVVCPHLPQEIQFLIIGPLLFLIVVDLAMVFIQQLIFEPLMVLPIRLTTTFLFRRAYYREYYSKSPVERAEFIVERLREEAREQNDTELLDVLSYVKGFHITTEFPAKGKVRDLPESMLYISKGLTEQPSTLRYFILRRARGSWLFNQREWRKNKMYYLDIMTDMSEFLLQHARYVGTFHSIYEFLVFASERAVIRARHRWKFTRLPPLSRFGIHVVHLPFSERQNFLLFLRILLLGFREPFETIYTIEEAKQEAIEQMQRGENYTPQRFAGEFYFSHEFAAELLREIIDAHPELRGHIFDIQGNKIAPNAQTDNHGFVQSRGGEAPGELATIRKEQRGKLTPVDIANFDEIIEYIRSKIEEFETNIPQAQTAWERENLPKYLDQAKTGLEHLEELYENNALFSFPAIVYTKEDFALAYGDENEIGAAGEFISTMPMELLAELFFHEAICYKAGHQAARQIQQYIFRENYYRDAEGVLWKSRLQIFLREFIDQMARTKNGVDYLEIIQAVLGEDSGVIPVFTDKSDYPAECENRQWQWQGKMQEMLRADQTFVFYGQFETIGNAANQFDSAEEEIKSKRHFKVLLDKEQGLVGAWDVPEDLNEKIRSIIQDIDYPVLVDIAPFVISVRLYEAGYSPIEGVLKKIIQQTTPICSFEELGSVIQTYNQRWDRLSKLNDRMDEMKSEENYFLKEQLGVDASDIHSIFGLLLPETLKNYLRRFVLETDIDTGIMLLRLGEIFVEGVEDMFWEFYLDANNTKEENERFLEVLAALLFNSNIDTFRTIARIFREKDIEKTYKAMDVLFRLRIGRKNLALLFSLLENVRYKKEAVASFCLLQANLVGIEAEPLWRREDSHLLQLLSGRGPTINLLTPESQNIYYYLLKMEERRKKGGVTNAAIDNRIVRNTIMLDSGAGYAGEYGRTWFSLLRNRIHHAGSSRDRRTIKTVLYFWKALNEDMIRDSKDELIANLKKDIGAEKTRTYSEIINQMLNKLLENGQIKSLAGDSFLAEILNMSEEDVIKALHEANPDAQASDLEKVEYMIRLYYALSERYGVVAAAIVPKIKGEIGAENEREGRKKNMLELTSFMQQEYAQLISVIDTDGHKAVLSAIAECRRAIRQHLLFDRNDRLENKEELMKLDYNMFMLGKEMIVRGLEEINQCQDMEDLKEYVPSLVSMAKFMHASGLGGIDFAQFIEELEHGRMKYSQVHDLVRALRTEVHKINRKINENMRFAMGHFWDNLQLADLTQEWQDRIKTEKRIDEFGGESEVISEEGKEQAASEFIDGLIRDTGILAFDDALMRFNQILENELTLGNDEFIDGGDSTDEIVMEEQFFRFGQEEDVIPRERLLSLWSKKGLNLVWMTEQGIPVPPGVVISARLITRPEISKSEEFKEEVEGEIARLREYSKYPELKLLLYARNGSAFALPGLLVTIPNLGMNDKEAQELAEQTGDVWFAYDTYAEFIRAYAIHILGIPEEYFEEVLNIYEKDDMSGEEMIRVCERYKEIVSTHGKGAQIPEDMIVQVMLAIDTVYASWDSAEAQEYRARHRISQEWGSVVILQKGVFGNLSPTADGKISGAGAAALRILPDGREVVQGRFRFQSTGDQVMSRAGQNYVLLSNTERVFEHEQTLEELQPEIYQEILAYAYQLKEIFGNNQHFEFTVELGKLWLTQTNDDIIQDDYPEFVDSPDYEPIARGHGVSGGAFRGWVANSAEAAEELLEKYEREQPEDVDGVILFLDRVNPQMINRIPRGVHIVAQIISVHAETLAQTYGITAVYGVANMKFYDEEERKGWYLGEHKMEDGRVISIDGHENQLVYHNSGKIYLGSVPLAESLDGQAEPEQRTPRALRGISALRDQKQWEAAMASRASRITAFEREILAMFERFLRGEAERGEIMRYLINYRVILDKIVRYCEDLNFEVYGEEFKTALEIKLAELGISFELFINLNSNYYSRGQEHREILRRIIHCLNYRPLSDDLLDQIVVYNKHGQPRVIREEELYQRMPQTGNYFIIHPPQQDIKLVSFEFEEVLEKVLQGYGIEGLLELFKNLKSMGLRVAITIRNPNVLRWFSNVKNKHPEIAEYVDYCYKDVLNGPLLQRYVEELGLLPGQIMHFGNSWKIYSSSNSHAAEMHSRGFVSVLVPLAGGVFLRSDVLEKKVDAFVFGLWQPQDILDIVEAWVNVSPQQWEGVLAGPVEELGLKQIVELGLVESAI